MKEVRDAKADSRKKDFLANYISRDTQFRIQDMKKAIQDAEAVTIKQK